MCYNSTAAIHKTRPWLVCCWLFNRLLCSDDHQAHRHRMVREFVCTTVCSCCALWRFAAMRDHSWPPRVGLIAPALFQTFGCVGLRRVGCRRFVLALSAQLRQVVCADRCTPCTCLRRRCSVFSSRLSCSILREVCVSERLARPCRRLVYPL